MTKQTKAELYWHCHHNKPIMEICEPNERIRYIEKHKPANEIPIRLKLLKRVEGKLPNEVVIAAEAYWEALKVYRETEEAWDRSRTWRQRHKKAYRAHWKAFEAYDEALRNNMPAILELHARECGCDWTPERGINFEGGEQ